MTSSVYARVRQKKTWQQHSTCRLVVSVGRPNHEGDKLDATIQWVNRHFENCIFVLCDVLHRHNYIADGFSSSEAYAISKHDGDIWLSRNKERINNLIIPYNIIRWEECLNHPDFSDRLHKITGFCSQNSAFQRSIREDIDRFIRTQKKTRSLSFTEEKQIGINGKALLLEEVAGCSLLVEQDLAVDIYPGSEIKAVKLFREKDLPPILPILKKRAFARMDFSH